MLHIPRVRLDGRVKQGTGLLLDQNPRSFGVVSLDDVKHRTCSSMGSFDSSRRRPSCGRGVAGPKLLRDSMATSQGDSHVCHWKIPAHDEMAAPLPRQMNATSRLQPLHSTDSLLAGQSFPHPFRLAEVLEVASRAPWPHLPFVAVRYK